MAPKAYLSEDIYQNPSLGKGLMLELSGNYIRVVKSTIKKLLHRFGLVIIKESTFEEMSLDVLGNLRNLLKTKELTSVEKRILQSVCQLIIENDGNFYSQLGQDLIALAVNGEKNSGFYVEIGAGDSIRSSNTYLLQMKYNWNGILVEPNPGLASNLGLSRSKLNAPLLVPKAITEKIGTELFLRAGLLSTLYRFTESDDHAKERRLNLKKGGLISVETIPPIEFVKQYLSSQPVNFLSIDTEGSEFPIISNWPFEICKPSFISVEHNNRQWKYELDSILHFHGYQKILPNLSKFESWYIHLN